MEYLRGIRVLRQDPEALNKVLVGSLLLLVGVVPLLGLLSQMVLIGWAAMVVRQSIREEPRALPPLPLDLDYLGKLLMPGFKSFIVTLLWMLPANFLLVGLFVTAYAGTVISLMMAQRGDEGGFWFLGIVGLASPFVLLFALILGIPAQMAILRTEISDDLGQGFRFGDVLDMTRKVLRELVIGSLLIALVQLVGVLGSLLLCGLPLYPLAVVMFVVRAHFAAQLYRLYLERGGVPVTAASPIPFAPAAAHP